MKYNVIRNYMSWFSLVLVTITIISSLTFYDKIVGGGGTNAWSVLFGWQWLYVAIISIFFLMTSLVKKNKILLRAVLIVISGLAAVLIPAQLVYANRYYITGDGGPAGPDMACLVWNKSEISGAYRHKFGLCTLMSMPSLNKFLIDRRNYADATDSSISYYITLVIDETVIIGGLLLAKRKLYTPS